MRYTLGGLLLGLSLVGISAPKEFIFDSSLYTNRSHLPDNQIPFNIGRYIPKSEEQQGREAKILVYPKGLTNDVLRHLWSEGERLRRSTFNLNLCMPGTMKKWMDYSARVESYLQQQLSSTGGELSTKDTTEFEILKKNYLPPENRRLYQLGCQETLDYLKEQYEEGRFYELLWWGLLTLAVVSVAGIYEGDEVLLKALALTCFLTVVGSACAAVWLAFSPAEMYSPMWIIPRVLARMTVPFIAGTLFACYLLRKLPRR